MPAKSVRRSGNPWYLYTRYKTVNWINNPERDKTAVEHDNLHSERDKAAPEHDKPQLESDNPLPFVKVIYKTLTYP